MPNVTQSAKTYPFSIPAVIYYNVINDTTMNKSNNSKLRHIFLKILFPMNN